MISKSKIVLLLRLVCIVIVIMPLFLTQLSATGNELINSLINEINNKIEYGYSRRYTSYIIDEFIINNPELIKIINFHENELQYIQIEDKEAKSIAERRNFDYQYNTVLTDEYYKSLVKPYTYLYLGFSVLYDSEGFFTFHYFKKDQKKEDIEISYQAVLTYLTDLGSTKTFVADDGSTIELDADGDYWLNLTPDKETIYELRKIEPFGIFYRKVSINYLYNYIIKNFPKDEKLKDYNLETKQKYIFKLIEHLNTSKGFDPLDFILNEFRIRG